MNPDVALFHFINDFVGTVPLIDLLTRLIVNDFAVPTLVSLIGVSLWFGGATASERLRNQRCVVYLILGLVFSNALIKDLSYVYFRPRPFATEPVKLLFYRPSVSSFPSVPIAVAFSFAAGDVVCQPPPGTSRFRSGCALRSGARVCGRPLSLGCDRRSRDWRRGCVRRRSTRICV